jgi:hypothetical protein
MLSQACEGKAVKNASVYGWHKSFKEGHENVKDDERCSRAHKTDENVEKVRNVAHSNV